MRLTLKTTLHRLPTLATILAVLLLLPFVAYAQEFIPLTAIPNVPERGGTLADYVNALFLLSIAIGALLAVIKIAVGGFQYMMIDVVTTKESARKDITGALLGLGILLASVTILYTINRDILNLNALGDAQPTTISSQPPSAQPTPTNATAGRTFNQDTGSLEAQEAFIAECEKNPGYGYSQVLTGDGWRGLCSPKSESDTTPREQSTTGVYMDNSCISSRRWDEELQKCVPNE